MGSSSSSEPPAAVTDLIVLVHGLDGGTMDWAKIQPALKARISGAAGARVLVSTANKGVKLCRAGVDVGGKKLRDEIVSFLSKHPLAGERKHKIRLSFIAHSLGGLFTRYCIGLLEEAGLFDDVFDAQAVVFISSPFLGVRRPDKGAWNGFLTLAGTKFMTLGVDSPTLVHLSLLDGDVEQTSLSSKISFTHRLFEPEKARGSARNQATGATRLPLLAQMAHVRSTPMYGLRRFQRRTVMANLKGDAQVPFTTACVSNDASARTAKKEGGRSTIVRIQPQAEVVAPPDGPSEEWDSMDLRASHWIDDENTEVYYNQDMMRHLASLGWERVQVRFDYTPPLTQHWAILYSAEVVAYAVDAVINQHIVAGLVTNEDREDDL